MTADHSIYISVSFARALWSRIEGCHRGFYFPDVRTLAFSLKPFGQSVLEQRPRPLLQDSA